MLMVIDVCEPGLNVWNTFSNCNVGLRFINHENRLCKYYGAQVLSGNKLRHDIFSLHSYQHHSVWVTSISVAPTSTKGINKFDVNLETLRASLQKTIKLPNSSLCILFKGLKSM
jgi:hypothetical protein